MNMVLRGRESHARRTFIEITPELRRLLETVIEAAIDTLDQIDGDPDLEDGGDLEPSFGWTEREGRFGVKHQALDELEPDNDDEDGADAEPDEDREDVGDDEPSLGWCEPLPNRLLLGGIDDFEDACEDEGAQCDDEGADCGT